MRWKLWGSHSEKRKTEAQEALIYPRHTSRKWQSQGSMVSAHNPLFYFLSHNGLSNIQRKMKHFYSLSVTFCLEKRGSWCQKELGLWNLKQHKVKLCPVCLKARYWASANPSILTIYIVKIFYTCCEGDKYFVWYIEGCMPKKDVPTLFTKYLNISKCPITGGFFPPEY